MERRDEEAAPVRYSENDMTTPPIPGRDELTARLDNLRTRFAPAAAVIRKSVKANVRIWRCDSRLVTALHQLHVGDEASPLEDPFATLIRERDGYRRLMEGTVDVRDIAFMEEGDLAKVVQSNKDLPEEDDAPQVVAQAGLAAAPLPVAYFLANDIASVQSQIDSLDESARESGRLGPLIDRRRRGEMSALDHLRAAAFRLSKYDRERERLVRRHADLSNDLARLPVLAEAPEAPIVVPDTRSPLMEAIAARREVLSAEDRKLPSERDRTLVSLGCSSETRKIVLGDDGPERLYAYQFCRVQSDLRQKARALTRAAGEGDLSAGLAIARVMGAEEAKTLISEYREALVDRRAAEALRGADAQAGRIFDIAEALEKVLKNDTPATDAIDFHGLIDRIENTSDYLPMERLFQEVKTLEKSRPAAPMSDADAASRASD